MSGCVNLKKPLGSCLLSPRLRFLFQGFLLRSFAAPLPLPRCSFAGDADDVIVRPFSFPAERLTCPPERERTHIPVYVEEARAQSVDVTCLRPHSDGTAAGGGVRILRPHGSRSPRPGRSSRSPEAVCSRGDVEAGTSPWSSHGSRGAAPCILGLAPRTWPLPLREGRRWRPESGQLALGTHAPGPSRPRPSSARDARWPRSPTGPLCPGLAPCRWANSASGTHLWWARLSGMTAEVLATPCAPCLPPA